MLTRERHHSGGDAQGYGAGTTRPICPGDRRDGRCNVLRAGCCGVRHRAAGSECGAIWTYCVAHGIRWAEAEVY